MCKCLTFHHLSGASCSIHTCINICDRNDWGEDYVGCDNDPFHGVNECETNKNNATYIKYGSDKLYLD